MQNVITLKNRILILNYKSFKNAAESKKSAAFPYHKADIPVSLCYLPVNDILLSILWADHFTCFCKFLCNGIHICYSSHCRFLQSIKIHTGSTCQDLTSLLLQSFQIFNGMGIRSSKLRPSIIKKHYRRRRLKLCQGIHKPLIRIAPSSGSPSPILSEVMATV